MYLMNTRMREYDINVFAHQTGRLQEDTHLHIHSNAVGSKSLILH